MMLRQSHLKLIGLAGILFFVTGLALDFFSGKEGSVQLKLGLPAESIRYARTSEESHPDQGVQGLTARLDSLDISPVAPVFEIQVREVEAKQQYHPGSLSTSMLKDAYPLEPMKIRRTGETEYRFRLIEFYPDFAFTYTYPEHQDTIAPRSPGITLSLLTPLGEQIVTLGSVSPYKNQLEDVIRLGFALEFLWDGTPDSLHAKPPDTGERKNKIVFTGRDRKIFFRAEGKVDSLPLVLNRFYPIPGRDTVGFTVLQCFPDAALLKAIPSTKSDSFHNPVARIEVWKKGGNSEEVYAYPAHATKRGGQWNVPESNLLITLGLSHQLVSAACACSISFMDSIRNETYEMALKRGKQHFSFRGKKWKLDECDPNGFWINLLFRDRPGHLPVRIGFILIALSLLGFMVARRSGTGSKKKDLARL